jgi:uncharacterized tellurite resistance protein B-like protein
MIGNLIRRLMDDGAGEPLSVDMERLALAALLVRMARTDGQYSALERSRIERVLADTYRLGVGEAAALRQAGETEEADAPDTVRFTRVIKETVPYEQRTGVVEALWRVAAADGINADEHGLMRLTASLLGVSDQDSGLARQRVLRQDGA